MIILELILYIIYACIIFALEIKLNQTAVKDKITPIGYCIAQVSIIILLLSSVYIIPYLLSMTTQ